MYELLKRIVMKVLKVPPEPEAPEGDSDSLKVFRASKDYYRYRFYVWLLRQGTLLLFAGLPAIGGLVAMLAVMSDEPLGALLMGAGSAAVWRTQ